MLDNDGHAQWVAELSSTIRALPDRQATAIRLVYTHGLPISEAAEWAGVSGRQMTILLADALRSIGNTISGKPTIA